MNLTFSVLRSKIVDMSKKLAIPLVIIIALVMLTVGCKTKADAAHLRTWERLAQCESGKRWHINTGNGYYGGLQFSPATWHAYGGGRFAYWPHHATKRQQIRIATKVMHNQGWNAWPACSDKLNLGPKDKMGKPHWAWW